MREKQKKALSLLLCAALLLACGQSAAALEGNAADVSSAAVPPDSAMPSAAVQSSAAGSALTAENAASNSTISASTVENSEAKTSAAKTSAAEDPVVVETTAEKSTTTTGIVMPAAAEQLNETQLAAAEEIAAQIHADSQTDAASQTDLSPQESEIPNPGTPEPVIVVAQSDPVPAKALAEIPGAVYVSSWVYPAGNDALGSSLYQPQTTTLESDFSGSYTQQLTGLAAVLAEAMTGEGFTRAAAVAGTEVTVDVTPLLSGQAYSDSTISGFKNNVLRAAFCTALNAVMADDPFGFEWLGFSNGANTAGGVRYGISAESDGAGNISSATVTLTPDYNKFCTEQALAARDAALAEIGAGAPHESAAGDIKYFHDTLCELAVYSNSVLALAEPLGDQRGYFAHTGFGPLLAQNPAYQSLYAGTDGNAVCESYAHIFKALCDADPAFEIPCVLLTSMVSLSSGGISGHAWNAVRGADGAWYLLDATWDDVAGAAPRYDYFYQQPVGESEYGAAFHTPCGLFSMAVGTPLTSAAVVAAPRAASAALTAQNDACRVGETPRLAFALSPTGAVWPWAAGLQSSTEAFAVQGDALRAAQRGTAQLTASDPLGLVAVTGSAQLRAGLSGDANDDGEADVQDLVLLAEMITGQAAGNAFSAVMGDLNNDGALDVRDLALCAALMT